MHSTELPASFSRRPAVTSFVIFFVLGGLVFLVGGPLGSGGQPIAFNHAKHVQAGMGCTDCHAGAQTQEHATLPAISVCMTCHEAAVTQSAEEAKIRTLAAAKKELEWTQATRVPPHVYFSHRRHVAIGKLECAACHGPMQNLTAPPTKPYRQLTMNACIECHEKNHARTDCNDCHR